MIFFVLFHYNRRLERCPVFQGWMTNIGKFVVPNVFINTNLLQDFINKYDLEMEVKSQYGKAIISITKLAIEKVFQLEMGHETILNIPKLREEYFCMESFYKVLYYLFIV